MSARAPRDYAVFPARRRTLRPAACILFAMPLVNFVLALAALAIALLR